MHLLSTVAIGDKLFQCYNIIVVAVAVVATNAIRPQYHHGITTTNTMSDRRAMKLYLARYSRSIAF